MAFNPIGATRVPFLFNETIAQDNLRVRQQAVTRASIELSTNRKINLFSDDPNGATRSAVFQTILGRNTQYLANLNVGSQALGQTESTLRAISDAVDAGTDISLRNSQSLQSDAEIAGDISAIDAIIDDLLNQANQRYADRFTFGGQQIADPPFYRDGIGIAFRGDEETLQTLANIDDFFNVSVTPNGSIGTESLAGRSGDLDPNVTLTTRLTDLNGGNGASPGFISVDIGGGPVTVDLTNADNVGDVIDIINNTVGAGTAALNAAGNGLQINGAGPITIQEIGGGITARTLGIFANAAAGPTYVGADISPRITPTTALADLRGGLGIDTSVPLVIRNGSSSATVDLSTATTVEDALNLINASVVGVRAEINASGNGINVVNVRAGTGFEIVEANAAGTAAQDLGILTTNLSTPLSEFNEGAGILTDPNGPDLSITLRDGTTQNIELDGAQTVGDVKAIIENAFGAANIQVVPNPLGGLQLNDLTGGAGNFIVADINNSKAASDLGVAANVASSQIAGTQQHLSHVKGIFDSLLRLRQGLVDKDLDQIEIADGLLRADSTRVLDAIGSVGTRLQVLDTTIDRISTENLQIEGYNAEILEPDFAATVTKLLAENNALQATLQATSRLLQPSLLDFL